MRCGVWIFAMWLLGSLHAKIPVVRDVSAITFRYNPTHRSQRSYMYVHMYMYLSVMANDIPILDDNVHL